MSGCVFQNLSRFCGTALRCPLTRPDSRSSARNSRCPASLAREQRLFPGTRLQPDRAGKARPVQFCGAKRLYAAFAAMLTRRKTGTALRCPLTRPDSRSSARNSRCPASLAREQRLFPGTRLQPDRAGKARPVQGFAVQNACTPLSRRCADAPENRHRAPVLSHSS